MQDQCIGRGYIVPGNKCLGFPILLNNHELLEGIAVGTVVGFECGSQFLNRFLLPPKSMGRGGIIFGGGRVLL